MAFRYFSDCLLDDLIVIRSRIEVLSPEVDELKRVVKTISPDYRFRSSSCVGFKWSPDLQSNFLRIRLRVAERELKSLISREKVTVSLLRPYPED